MTADGPYKVVAGTPNTITIMIDDLTEVLSHDHTSRFSPESSSVACEAKQPDTLAVPTPAPPPALQDPPTGPECPIAADPPRTETSPPYSRSPL